MRGAYFGIAGLPCALLRVVAGKVVLRDRTGGSAGARVASNVAAAWRLRDRWLPSAALEFGLLRLGHQYFSRRGDDVFPTHVIG